MKKTFFIVVMAIMSLMATAQNKDSDDVEKMLLNDVTTFLGIPVDGTPKKMKKAIIKKGFVSKKSREGIEYLQGQFNGQDVMVVLATHHGKVYRVYIQEKNGVSEAFIKIHYNNLVKQFENNPNYVKPETDQTITDDIDISREMNNNEYRFIAEFYQKNKTIEFPNLKIKGLILKNKKVWFRIGRQGDQYYLAMYYDNEYNKPDGDDL